MATVMRTMCIGLEDGTSADVLEVLNAYFAYDLTWIELDMMLAALSVRPKQRQQMSYAVFLSRGMSYTTVQ